MHCNNKRHNEYFERKGKLQHHMRKFDRKEDGHCKQGIEEHYRMCLRLSLHAVLK